MSTLDSHLSRFEVDYEASLAAQRKLQLSADEFGRQLRYARLAHPKYRKPGRLAAAAGVSADDVVCLEAGTSRNLTAANAILLLDGFTGYERRPEFPAAWEDDEDHCLSDWQLDVRDGNTRQSYVDWVMNQREQAAYDAENEG